MRLLDGGLESTIGLTVDSGWVCAVQLRGGRARGGSAGRAAVRFRRLEAGGPLTVTEARRTLSVLSRHGFVGRRLALAAPEEQLLTTTLQLPAGLEADALAPVVRMEMARAASSRPDGLEAGHLLVAAGERHRQRQTVYAAALRHEDAAATMEPLLEAGADVVAIEPAGAAALRAVRSLMSVDVGAVTGVLDVGWDRAQVIVALGGAFAYARTDDELGVGKLIERAARLTGLAPALADHAVHGGLEAARPAVRRQMADMAERLGRLAEAAQAYVLQEHRGSRDAGLLVHGPGAAVPGLMEAALEPVELGFTRVSPETVCRFSRCRHAAEPSLITALGLAMEGETS